MNDEKISTLLERTFSKNPRARQRAAGELCPCHVKRDIDAVWERICEMSRDSDPGVRRAVVHSMTDGSPRVRADTVLRILEGMKSDEDRKTRRMVRHHLARFKRTGILNIPE